ncbi:MAG: C-GCAxxG-C-C family protein [Spirochaetes bacterium]|jgi:C_GCAxxG_C_C family probable redox protein|nr:C-GCAxxG-C-C family protein [Spirochaetota bacterium]
MSIADKAEAVYNEGFNCAQAVFSVFAEKENLDPSTSFKIASGFGGGMASMGETCGAVTGAFMAIGLKYGRFRAGDHEAKKRTNGIIREFTRRFIEKNSTLLCRELLKLNLNDPAQYKEASEKNLFRDLCPKFVRDSAEILDSLLKENG